MDKRVARYRKLVQSFGFQPTEYSHTLQKDGFELQWLTKDCRIFIPSKRKGEYIKHWYKPCDTIKEVLQFWNIHTLKQLT